MSGRKSLAICILLILDYARIPRRPSVYLHPREINEIICEVYELVQVAPNMIADSFKLKHLPSLVWSSTFHQLHVNGRTRTSTLHPLPKSETKLLAMQVQMRTIRLYTPCYRPPRRFHQTLWPTCSYNYPVMRICFLN